MKLLALLCFLAASVKAAPLSDLDTELNKSRPDNRTINIVFHGHSVPSGYFATPLVRPFDSYPHLFHRDLKTRYPNAVINVITTSIGGENSIPGAARFQQDVFKHKPDLIFIDYALNDRTQNAAQVEAAWRSMITAAKTANVPVILCTPTGDTREDLSDPANPLRVLADMIRRIATEENVLLADVSAAWVAALQSGTNQNTLHSTANHPNAAGHRIAADAIFAAFVAATENTP
jgi:acyl-CoA thioesterase I